MVISNRNVVKGATATKSSNCNCDISQKTSTLSNPTNTLPSSELLPNNSGGDGLLQGKFGHTQSPSNTNIDSGYMCSSKSLFNNGANNNHSILGRTYVNKSLSMKGDKKIKDKEKLSFEKDEQRLTGLKKEKKSDTMKEKRDKKRKDESNTIEKENKRGIHCITKFFKRINNSSEKFQNNSLTIFNSTQNRKMRLNFNATNTSTEHTNRLSPNKGCILSKNNANAKADTGNITSTSKTCAENTNHNVHPTSSCSHNNQTKKNINTVRLSNRFSILSDLDCSVVLDDCNETPTSLAKNTKEKNKNHNKERKKLNSNANSTNTKKDICKNINNLKGKIKNNSEIIKENISQKNIKDLMPHDENLCKVKKNKKQLTSNSSTNHSYPGFLGGTTNGNPNCKLKDGVTDFDFDFDFDCSTSLGNRHCFSCNNKICSLVNYCTSCNSGGQTQTQTQALHSAFLPQRDAGYASSDRTLALNDDVISRTDGIKSSAKCMIRVTDTANRLDFPPSSQNIGCETSLVNTATSNLKDLPHNNVACCSYNITNDVLNVNYDTNSVFNDKRKLVQSTINFDSQQVTNNTNNNNAVNNNHTFNNNMTHYQMDLALRDNNNRTKKKLNYNNAPLIYTDNSTAMPILDGRKATNPTYLYNTCKTDPKLECTKWLIPNSRTMLTFEEGVRWCRGISRRVINPDSIKLKNMPSVILTHCFNLNFMDLDLKRSAFSEATIKTLSKAISCFCIKQHTLYKNFGQIEFLQWCKKKQTYFRITFVTQSNYHTNVTTIQKSVSMKLEEHISMKQSFI